MGAFTTKNFTNPDTKRALTAFGGALSLGRDATQVEAEAELTAMVSRLTIHQERLKKTKLIVDDPDLA